MGRATLPLLCLAAFAVPGTVFAQGLNVDTFSPSGAQFDGQGTLQLAHPHLGQQGAWYAGLGVSYAKNPLVHILADGSQEVLVASQLGARVMGGYTLAQLLRIDLEIPTYPSVTTADGSSFALGDIRLGATVPVLKYDDEGFGLALVPALSLPTGSQAAWLSNGGVGFGVDAAAGLQTGDFGLVANIGVDLTKGATVGDYTLGTALPWGVGAHVNMAEEFLLGVELDGAVTLAGGLGPYNKNPVEAHLYGTYGGGDGLLATLGLGTGVVAGIGAPDFRIFLGLAYRNPGGPPDTDGDGLADPEDTCPEQPEDVDNYEDADGCPDPDNDKDGVPDTADGCPNTAEDIDRFEDENGCPDTDNDQDGLLDAVDHCPDEPGPQATSGCPDGDGDGLADKEDECPSEPGPLVTDGCPDQDNDRVPDLRDACPTEPADPRIDPRRSNGCPSRVVVTKQKIEILEMVYFETNKAVIKPISFGLLDDVAKTLNQYPEIKVVEVSGHTDNVGNDASNLKLSQARAESVMKYLVAQGSVDPNRLVARGYGEEKPIDTNDSAEGRAKNRRVEFVIVEQ